MSGHLTQFEIVEKTGYVRPNAQERKLRELGYIVLGKNGKGRLQVLESHPLQAVANDDKDKVVLNI